MAGEWIKFEASTPEKQEVFSITVAMGWDDPDLTVGKLLKVWRWFDQQTVDGNAPRVTSALLDRIIGVSGFAQAMCDVGWLVSDETGLTLPNFDRHNGKTAKDRALTAKRVANHKSNAKSNGKGNAEGNGASVTGALPKEEKRREEKTKAAAVPLPEWIPTKPWEDYLTMRKTIKKPLTGEGIPLAIAKLERLRAFGSAPKDVLEQSTLNSWQGLFEVKRGGPDGAPAPLRKDWE